MTIVRDPEAASQRTYDLLILGGGIYGAMLALEASLRGLSALVLEKDDFGGATSFNSLKTIHGGLRYLQTLHIKRFHAFAGEQRWFLEHFPDLVRPLPMLMPLYQRGLRRLGAFRAAFLLDRLLRRQHQRGVSAERQLPAGTILPPGEVVRRFPAVDPRRLAGGALWYDAWMPDSQRLLMAILRCACSLGATLLNYTPAIDLLKDQQHVTGVRARDALQGRDYAFSSRVVVNATGPWSRDVAHRFDRDVPNLFRPSIAWNILFDRAALSAHTVAVAPPRPGGPLYFLHPWKGRLLAGTGHAPRSTSTVADPPHPSPEELRRFLADLNQAVPQLQVNDRDILHVYAGFLPVKKEGTIRLARKACIVDHATHGGPAGLYSISGARFTTARRVAEAVLSRIFPGRTVPDERRARFRNACAAQPAANGVFDYHWIPDGVDASWREPVRRLINEEAVCHLDDLIFRRTSLGDNPARALHVAPALCDLFDWDDERCQVELRSMQQHYRWMRDAAMPGVFDPTPLKKRL